MQRTSDVENFLREASSVGEIGSEGCFTIAEAAAIEKLATLQLPRPTAWVLKPVQASVASQAAEIRIRQTAYKTFFEYSPQEAIPPEEFHAALVTAEVKTNKALAHLVVGVRAVGFGEKRPFKLGLVGSHQCDLFSWDGETLTRQTIALDSPVKPLVQLEVAFSSGAQGFSGLVRASAAKVRDEAEELVVATQACPVPIFLDGRRLDTLRSGLGSPGCRHRIVAIGFAAQESTSSFLPLRIPAGVATKTLLGNRILNNELAEGLFTRRKSVRGEAQALLRLVIHYRFGAAREQIYVASNHPSRCHWIQDGVLCETQPLDLPVCSVSLEVFLNADDIETDISGLRLKELHLHKARIDMATATSSPFIRNTLKAYTKWQKVRSRRPYLLMAASLAAFPVNPAAALTGMFFGPLSIIHSVVSGDTLGEEVRKSLSALEQSLSASPTPT